MKNVFYKENKTTKELAYKIEALNVAYKTLEPSIETIRDLLRKSLLKSALYSARIEGNPLSLSEVNEKFSKNDSQNFHQKEVSNLLSAYLFINSKNSPKFFSKEIILKLHQFIMRDISFQAGNFRKEHSAIFNQAGIAVYLAPSPKVIDSLIDELILFANQKSVPVLIKSAVTQFSFEKIHPFIDGNGRVGRLISAYILSKAGYAYLSSSLEEYINENKTLYYEALEPAKNANVFIEFYLRALLETAKKNFSKITESNNKTENIGLLPRRNEILLIIKDHPGCSFDFISRRFGNVNPKTLHYDIGQLLKKGLIFKIGKTRGALYQAKE